jgi:hypothetical protein
LNLRPAGPSPDGRRRTAVAGRPQEAYARDTDEDCYLERRGGRTYLIAD